MRVVLDLETTGPDPKTSRIIEVGAILVDENFEEVDRFESVAFAGPGSRASAVEVVQRMHDANGLWGEVATAPPLVEVDSAFASWLVSHGATAGSVELIGRSVHFDLGFARAQLPETAALLHYRILDTGAVLRLFQKAGVPIDLTLPHAETQHRSLADCEDELVEIQAAYQWLRVAAEVGVIGPVRTPSTSENPIDLAEVLEDLVESPLADTDEKSPSCDAEGGVE